MPKELLLDELLLPPLAASPEPRAATMGPGDSGETSGSCPSPPAGLLGAPVCRQRRIGSGS